MCNDSFVYRWFNNINQKSYIGYHKGTETDGYVCSSSSELFWEDFNNSNFIWKREILFRGSQNECVLKEIETIQKYGLQNLYNLSCGNGIFFNDEVRKKMSENHHSKQKDYTNPFKNKTHTDETKNKIRNSLKIYRSESVLKNISKNVSELWKDKNYIHKQRLSHSKKNGNN